MIHTKDPDNAFLYYAIGLTLSDGQKVKTGNSNNEYLMPESPLLKIAITYDKNEQYINHLTLAFADGTSKRLGWSHAYHDGRVDRYSLSKNEHLIGATIEHSSNGYLVAVTFHTVKMI